MIKSYLGLVLIIPSLLIGMHEPKDQKEIKWTDVGDYAKYIKDLHATNKDMQNYIKKVYGISDKKIDETRDNKKPVRDLFLNPVVGTYLKDNKIDGVFPWHVTASPKDAFRTLCNETSNSIGAALYLKYFT